MYAVQLKRARSQTPSVRSNSRADCKSTHPPPSCIESPSSCLSVPPLSRQRSPALSPIPSTSSGVRYLNKDPVSRMTTLCPTPTTAVSNEQVESGHPMECNDSACALLALATEGSAGMVKPKAEWQVRSTYSHQFKLVTSADPYSETRTLHSVLWPTAPPFSPPHLASISCHPVDITADSVASSSAHPTRLDPCLSLPALLASARFRMNESAIPASL